MDKKTMEKWALRSEQAAREAELRLEQMEAILKKVEAEFEEIKNIKSNLLKEQKKSIKKQLIKMSQKAAKKAAKKSQTIAKIKSQMNNK